ncbi:hypothetical protein GQ53DRAFT_827734 [Thozetella sp. PMI_491]|nr:hypothetical protein GQ53DRAFT_827734 [Thozetella sp. PMI_491]
MKAALFLVGAGIVLAQNLKGEPACATPCLVSAISKAGCAPSDMACQCGPTQSAIGSYAASCLIAACTSSGELLKAASVGSALCESYLATATGAKLTTASNATATSKHLTSGATSTGASMFGNSTTTRKTSTSSTTAVVPATTTSVATQQATSQTTTSRNGAATPAVLGVGALAGLLGMIAAL